ncbi:tripartite motif-containing protein 2-like isoform X1 [Centruroides sculpturatus]|uniref:tripartite motif-containing protein 2-like isoform X1 n=1 Tax=Centruroides sculpturatus TaxID=218467 RepID=UPI000C6E7115|nr:tripartite motif-containing protein 2-like isoform X1 [Centruroides sculpturatus]
MFNFTDFFTVNMEEELKENSSDLKCISIRASSRNKIVRIEGIKAILEKNYTVAKNSIMETIDFIRDEFLKDLDKVVQSKFALLNKMKVNLEEQSDSFERGILEKHLDDFLILNFTVNDVTNTKYSVGYIKTSPVSPDSFRLIITKSTYHIGTELKILVKGKRFWYPFLIHSLRSRVEDSDGMEISSSVKDLENGSYVLAFCLNNYGKFTIHVTLYGRNIINSPTVINIKRKDGYSKCSTMNRYERDEEYYDLTFEICDNSRIFYCTEESHVNDLTYDEEIKVDSVTGHLVCTISRENGVNLKFPIALAVNSNNEIVICDTGNNIVWLLDELGTPKNIVIATGSRKMVRPSAVVFVDERSFVVKDNYALHHFDTNGYFIKSFGHEELNRAFGLVLTEDEKLVTLNDATGNLAIFNKHGQMEDCSIFEPVNNKPKHSMCRFMASYKNELVVSDLGLNKVYKTSLQGKTIQSFGKFGRMPGEMHEPTGIAFDSLGTMIIADSMNDRIQIFDSECDYLGLVKLSRPIRRPSGITLTKDGWLYVLSFLDHTLSVFDLKLQE